jgi:hypothetical protein
MHCPNCGTPVEADHTFCSQCGDALDEERLARVAAADTGADGEGAESAVKTQASAGETPEEGTQEGRSRDVFSMDGNSITDVLPTVGGGRNNSSLTDRVGASDVPGHRTVVSTMDGDDTESPVWTFALLGGTWFVFVMGFENLLSGALGTSGLAALLALAAGVPLLWYDARETIAAGGLPVDRTWRVVVGVYALYVVTLPAYLCYRLYVGV